MSGGFFGIVGWIVLMSLATFLTFATLVFLKESLKVSLKELEKLSRNDKL